MSRNPTEQVNSVVDTILEKYQLFYVNWFSTRKCQNNRKNIQVSEH